MPFGNLAGTVLAGRKFFTGKTEEKREDGKENCPHWIHSRSGDKICGTAAHRFGFGTIVFPAYDGA
jgi:hypothetical protein